MDEWRVLADAWRRLSLHARRHGLISALVRAADRRGDPRGPSWRSYRKWLSAQGEPVVADGVAGRATDGAVLHGAGAAEPAAPASRVDAACAAPRISVLVPVHDPQPQHLRELADSVLAQTGAECELVLAEDRCRQPAVFAALTALAARDDRVRRVPVPEPGGIAAATNAAASAARGELLLFADHDDRFPPGAIARLAAAFAADPELDLVWGDEDQLTADGLRLAPSFKPGRNDLLLLGANFVMHPVMLRRELFAALGGLRTDFDGAQDHDLLLRAFEHTQRVRHVPGIAYHWRRAPGSLAASAMAKPAAFEASRRAVVAACLRRGLPVSAVSAGDPPGSFELHLSAPATPPRCDVVLRGPPRGVAAWSLLLSLQPCPLDVAGLHVNVWPAAESDAPLLVIDAALAPDAEALAALVRWSAWPGAGAVACGARLGRRRRDLGWSLQRTGLAQPLAGGLSWLAHGPGLFGTCAREVAAAGGALLWVAAPPSWWRRAHAGAPATLADELLLSAIHAPSGAATIFLPRPCPVLVSGPTAVPVDLARCAAWPRLRDSLPAEFWEGETDRFCPRHELLVELGLPAPVRATQSGISSV